MFMRCSYMVWKCAIELYAVCLYLITINSEEEQVRGVDHP